MRLAAQAKGGFYPTPDRVVDMIADLIGTPTGYYYHNQETLRVLDPCCGVGDAVDRLAKRIHGASAIPVETYGVELHSDRAEDAARRLHRTLSADLFRTSIANGAFSVLYLNPPYDWTRKRERSTPSSLTPPGTWRRRACWCSSFPGSGWRYPPATSQPITGVSDAGPSPILSRRSSTRWS